MRRHAQMYSKIKHRVLAILVMSLLLLIPVTASFAEMQIEYEYDQLGNRTRIRKVTCEASVRIAGATPVYYQSLQAAYDAAQNGDTIQSRAGTMVENLAVNRSVTVTMEGGYDCEYTAKTGKTILAGNMDVTGGTIAVGDFSLE
jgi:hypothetical protein